jgi:NTP pyrophosphatase (non-canonical NTP hydrolase)
MDAVDWPAIPGVLFATGRASHQRKDQDIVNRLEHLLTITGEEGMEVAHRASKANRFGLTETQPGQDQTNWERLLDELHDLLAAVEMVSTETGLPIVIGREQIEAKKAKVEKFLAYSRDLGTLQEPT